VALISHASTKVWEVTDSRTAAAIAETMAMLKQKVLILRDRSVTKELTAVRLH
jgi:hypothetical protein